MSSDESNPNSGEGNQFPEGNQFANQFTTLLGLGGGQFAGGNQFPPGNQFQYHQGAQYGMGAGQYGMGGNPYPNQFGGPPYFPPGQYGSYPQPGAGCYTQPGAGPYAPYTHPGYGPYPQPGAYPQSGPGSYVGAPQPGAVSSPRPVPIPPPMDDVYRPTMFGTPASDGSTNVPETQTPVIDLNFSTDLYELSDMEPSPPKSPPTAKTSKSTGKTKVGESAEAPKARRPRSFYTVDESKALAKCWADVSEDPVIANNQQLGGFWGRIARKYERMKPDWAAPHKPADLRKHWDRIMRECRRFHSIYDGHMRDMGSGETEPSVRQLSLDKFQAIHNGNGFKFWETYQELKDFPKFRSGLEAERSRSVRTRLNVEGSYSSSGDNAGFSAGQQLSEPPPRPMGNKKAKERAKAAKGKGKVGQSSSGSDAQSAPAMDDGALGQAALVQSLTGMFAMHAKMKTPASRASVWKTICQVKKKLGLVAEDAEDDPEPDVE